MKYVAVHGALTAVTLWVASAVTWLVLSNINDVTSYPLALAALMVVVLVWFPFGISLNETIGEYKALMRRRRRLSKRRHPSKNVRTRIR
jgi:hypothetical protein